MEASGDTNGAMHLARPALARRDPSAMLAQGNADVRMARVLKDRKGRAMVREREREIADAQLRGMVIFERARTVVAVTVGAHRQALLGAVQIDRDWSEMSTEVRTIAAAQAIDESLQLAQSRLSRVVERASSLAEDVLLG